ncbi:MAG TPA: two-component regulator propeller domain-containing protein, partial [Bacteroidales bacterium]|nr:two-component regulator propeller domain-containing protein [Bacteroidales bacterium]
MILFIAICSNVAAYGREPSTAVLYNSSGGISSNRINDIMQDSKGFLWVATRDGLNRFDGYDFLVFRPDIYDSLSLISENILAIEESPSGNIWVSTNKGISQYNIREDRFSNISFYPRFIGTQTNVTYDLKFVNDSVVYCLLSDRLIKYFPAKNVFAEIMMPSNIISEGNVMKGKMHFDSNTGVIYIATNLGLLMHRTGTREIIMNQYTRGTRINDLYQEGGGQIYLASGKGLIECRISDGSGMPERCRFIYSGKSIEGIEEYKDKQLLLATRNEVIHYDTRSRSVVQFKDIHIAGYERMPVIREILIDVSHNLWIGTIDGICKSDLKPKKFTVFNEESTGFQLNNDMISSILEKDSTLYLGSWGGGFQVLNLKNGVNKFYEVNDKDNFYPERSVSFIYSDSKDRIWTGFSGIYLFNAEDGTFADIADKFDIPGIHNMDASLIFDILELDDHTMVFSRRNGLLFLDESKGSFYIDSIVRIDSLDVPLADVTSVEKNQDKIWVACRSGLICYDLGGSDHQYYPFHSADGLSDRILTMKIDSRQRLWLGTPTGLFRFDKENESYVGYSVNIGLANDYIYAIEEDYNGLLWLSTNKGIISLNPENEKIRNYGVQHGLSCMEFNLHASYYSKRDVMYFGGIEGVNFFKTDSVNKPMFLPNTEITGVR